MQISVNASLGSSCCHWAGWVYSHYEPQGTYLLLCCLIWAMGGGALAAVSRSISDVRLKCGQTAFPLQIRTHTQINTYICDVACVFLSFLCLTFGLWWPRCVWVRCRSSRSPRRRPQPARGWSYGGLCSWQGNSGSSLAVFPAESRNACPWGKSVLLESQWGRRHKVTDVFFFFFSPFSYHSTACKMYFLIKWVRSNLLLFPFQKNLKLN